MKIGFLKGVLSKLFARANIDEEFWSATEEALLSADLGLSTTEFILSSARGEKSVLDVKRKIRQSMLDILSKNGLWTAPDVKPLVIMAVGVNGVGKTTTIAKLAAYFKSKNKGVLMVAADTFRAAAIDQLKVWGERLNVPIVAGRSEGDPAAVAFDGVNAAIARGLDVVIIDTAGRLHTKRNLMEELKKISRVVERGLNAAPHERWLILDATVGQNGLVQAREFNEAIGLTGAIVAKMDGTAKGGIVFPIVRELQIPLRFLGIGEKLEDLEVFDAESFVDAIL